MFISLHTPSPLFRGDHGRWPPDPAHAPLRLQVTRTDDGAPPAQPPPQPATGAAAGSTKSTTTSAPPPSTSGVAVVGSKSVKPGGVQQVRYAHTAGTKAASTGGGLKKEVVKGRAAVDSSCPHADDCHVYEKGGDVYDALLNQTDIANNKNKYYIIQLLETDTTPHQYITWNRWGRVGEERGSQNAARSHGANLHGALEDFTKKFHDKTKNAWAERANFSTVSGKYTLIERDYGADAPAAAPAAPAASSSGGDAPKPAESKLDKRVQKFISLIADVKMMERHMREIGFDPAKMPLGKLKKTTVMQGYQVLQELSQCIIGPGALSSGGGGGTSGGGGSTSAGSGGPAPGASGRINELSNRFYTLIPHTATGERGTRTKLEPISTPSLLKAKIEMVEALGNIELASRVLDTKSAAFETHPIDARYNQLKAKLTPIDVASSLHKMLSQYLVDTHASTHSSYSLSLEQAFEVEREGEAATFNASEPLGNRALLWHGSRLTNWCGILSGGLRIAPPEAPVTGMPPAMMSRETTSPPSPLLQLLTETPPTHTRGRRLHVREGSLLCQHELQVGQLLLRVHAGVDGRPAAVRCCPRQAVRAPQLGIQCGQRVQEGQVPFDVGQRKDAPRPRGHARAARRSDRVGANGQREAVGCGLVLATLRRVHRLRYEPDQAKVRAAGEVPLQVIRVGPWIYEGYAYALRIVVAGWGGGGSKGALHKATPCVLLYRATKRRRRKCEMPVEGLPRDFRAYVYRTTRTWCGC
jgi:predicted DNA-binding WGR domain protein